MYVCIVNMVLGLKRTNLNNQVSNIFKPPNMGGFLFCIDILDNRIGQDNKNKILFSLDNFTSNIFAAENGQRKMIHKKYIN